jgi:hypothetical protein
MPRLLAVLMVPAALLAAVPAAPVPKNSPRNSPLYFPTKVGATWIYDCGGTEYKRTVTQVRPEAGGAIVVTVENVPRAEDEPAEVVEVSGAGLVRLVDGSCSLDPVWPIFKHPPKIGETWTWQSVEGQFQLVFTHTTRKPERVCVPAGSFWAVPVEEAVVVWDSRQVTTCWYAPGVGLVREDYDGDTVMVLKTFTPGKD